MKSLLHPLNFRLNACCLFLLLLPASSQATTPHVVTTILPLHALTSYIMQGIGEPDLLLQGAVSPHDYALRPSAMRTLKRADVAFMIDYRFELFLAKPLANTHRPVSVQLSQAEGVELLPVRAGGVWQQNDHDHGQAQPGYDYHLWLDPRNAAAMAKQIERTLSTLDPARQAHYQANTERLLDRLEALERTIQQQLKPVKTTPYIVFHDAYQYFEQRFNMNAVGSITLDPERATSASRIAAINAKITASGAECIFSEPQFTPRLVRTLAQDNAIKYGILDPLGSAIAAGPQAYFQLLQQLAQTLRECLQSS